MLQKELAKRLKARYDTKMTGNEWLEVSSNGIPLCRIKYNGQFLSNADQNLSDEYRSKIADIQDEISTVREYVGLYEHAPQMKADGVSDYRQLAVFGDTVLAATYNEKNGFTQRKENCILQTQEPLIHTPCRISTLFAAVFPVSLSVCGGLFFLSKIAKRSCKRIGASSTADARFILNQSRKIHKKCYQRL